MMCPSLQTFPSSTATFTSETPRQLLSVLQLERCRVDGTYRPCGVGATPGFTAVGVRERWVGYTSVVE